MSKSAIRLVVAKFKLHWINFFVQINNFFHLLHNEYKKQFS